MRFIISKIDSKGKEHFIYRTFPKLIFTDFKLLALHIEEDKAVRIEEELKTQGVPCIVRVAKS